MPLLKEDMGFTYDQLSVLGTLRKVYRCGPLSMFRKLHEMWKYRMSLKDLEELVNRFFHVHSANRHKMTTLTPAYHAEAYSVDDHRFDLRPFLYPLDFSWQKRALSEVADHVRKASSE
jgi:NAD+ synthase (glutamine-hydrolysing)